MPKWNVDPEHTVAEFTVRHMMVSWVHGQFNGCSGTIVFDPADMANASVEAEIETAGLYTGVGRRDNHLKSADFFDVEKFPKIAFRSTRVEVAALNHLKAFGNLTIHGVTCEVVLDVLLAGPSSFFDDDEKKSYTTYGFRATTDVNREDFGLKWNLEIDNGGFMVGKHIQLVVNVEADLID
jgi:polyisoprenoid-binding protein YceI